MRQSGDITLRIFADQPVRPDDAELFNTQMAIRQRLQDQEEYLR